ncbi:MAG TPA: TolC family protein [Bacteroidales bacterium]|nr:TolC family protein [Bacteroidales bacterium]
MKKTLLIFLLLGNLSQSFSQQLIKVDDAIDIALKNNFNILTARNNAAIDSINNTAGNAGMLPTISLNGNDEYSINNISQKQSSGGTFEADNAYTNSFNAEVALNWTLFDGGKMFVTKSRLNEIQALGEIQYREKVMQLVHDVVLAYYNVVKQEQQLSSINEVIVYNLERVKILEVSFGAGLTPKTNLLQAKIDLNVYQENAITQRTVISVSKRDLNELLSRDPGIEFEVEDSIPLNYHPEKDKLIQKIDSVNTSIQAFQKQVNIAQLTLKEVNSQLLPRLDATAAYSFLNINNEVGSILRNQTYGPSFGARISIPLYQGGNARRQIKTAKIDLQSANWDLQNTRLLANSQLQNAFTEFENQLQLLTIEKDNVVLAKENLDISMQRLRYGQTTSLEVREAQDSYEQSLTRLVNFKYNLKAAETRLKQLMAEL